MRDNNNKPQKQAATAAAEDNCYCLCSHELVSKFIPIHTFFSSFLCNLLFLCHFYFTTGISIITIQINMGETFLLLPQSTLTSSLLSIDPQLIIIIIRTNPCRSLCLFFPHKRRESHN
ncbi:hypothetical protein Lalb_Chr22g0352921 [Lupinus albus]|uniref:Transmembrane protein n=1 Tax=Lupinus albus TaxID=3870 RepID=A0A6A4NBQ2_LUPAL|nr:hypothetical protein Lalb_Chr22g0352921 [Lupinus albus]